MNAPWPTLYCTTVQGKILGKVGICALCMKFVAIPTYLTLLDEKRGSSSNFCSKRSKDNSREGKIHEESGYTRTYLVYSPR